MMPCLGCGKPLTFPLDRTGKVGCKNCGTRMFWSPSRGLHPLSNYEAVSRVEDLSIELPCPSCSTRLKSRDSLKKAKNIRCPACEVSFQWSPQKGVSLFDHDGGDEEQPHKTTPDFSDDIGTMPCPGCAKHLEFSVKDDACIRCSCGLCLHWAAQSGLKLAEKHGEKQMLIEGKCYELPELGTYTPLSGLKRSSEGGLAKFFGGLVAALLIALAGLLLLWDLAELRKVAGFSLLAAIAGGFATVVHSKQKRWLRSGAWGGILLVLNPLTVAFLNAQDFGDLSASFWAQLSSGPDHEVAGSEHRGGTQAVGNGFRTGGTDRKKVNEPLSLDDNFRVVKRFPASSGSSGGHIEWAEAGDDILLHIRRGDLGTRKVGIVDLSGYTEVYSYASSDGRRIAANSYAASGASAVFTSRDTRANSWNYHQYRNGSLVTTEISSLVKNDDRYGGQGLGIWESGNVTWVIHASPEKQSGYPYDNNDYYALFNINNPRSTRPVTSSLSGDKIQERKGEWIRDIGKSGLLIGYEDYDSIKINQAMVYRLRTGGVNAEPLLDRAVEIETVRSDGNTVAIFYKPESGTDEVMLKYHDSNGIGHSMSFSREGGAQIHAVVRGKDVYFSLGSTRIYQLNTASGEKTLFRKASKSSFWMDKNDNGVLAFFYRGSSSDKRLLIGCPGNFQEYYGSWQYGARSSASAASNESDMAIGRDLVLLPEWEDDYLNIGIVEIPERIKTACSISAASY